MPKTRPVAVAVERAALPTRVLIDSGPLVALFNRRDAWHERTVAWLQAHPGTGLVSTWPVLTEMCALLARRIHNDAALSAMRWVERGGVCLDRPEAGSLTEVLKAAERYSDLPLDLADASIAEAAGRLKLRDILSIDADFDIYRDRTGRSLRNLLRRVE